ncbi:hypothetical protein FZEAL_4150 [Fusarium zealandicum]|uniref:Uncharacterized protein n=1 Tax=Fusarium zealandicum TaxID=1053134 RepID=A0A8H4UM83_9HYPO|nr:hypothetical protein FZEAL_4150 [Fusarium zealandicum]
MPSTPSNPRRAVRGTFLASPPDSQPRPTASQRHGITASQLLACADTLDESPNALPQNHVSTKEVDGEGNDGAQKASWRARSCPPVTLDLLPSPLPGSGRDHDPLSKAVWKLWSQAHVVPHTPSRVPEGLGPSALDPLDSPVPSTCRQLFDTNNRNDTEAKPAATPSTPPSQLLLDSGEHPQECPPAPRKEPPKRPSPDAPSTPPNQLLPGYSEHPRECPPAPRKKRALPDPEDDDTEMTVKRPKLGHGETGLWDLGLGHEEA